jgi:type I restriction enzyme S subunit
MPVRQLNSAFFRYQLHAFDISKVFYNMGNGVRQGLNYSEFSRLMVYEPPIEEQNKIAVFLDFKCAEFDSLTADIQTQIDILEQYKRSVITKLVTKGLNPEVEMEDSGIQWIGQMPAYWDCIRGKYILRYLQRPVKEEDGVVTCFRDGEVTLRSNRREDGFTMSDKEIGYQGIDVGDLVVHGMDGFAGAIGISDSRGKASPVLNVLETDQNKRYIMYYLRSMAYSDVFVAMATGIRVRSCDLRWNKLAELMYPVPPIEEQKKIVDHIDMVIKKTDEVIADKTEQLSTIDEYKKSLIYEYVTGKKEVPVA